MNRGIIYHVAGECKRLQQNVGGTNGKKFNINDTKDTKGIWRKKPP